MSISVGAECDRPPFSIFRLLLLLTYDMGDRVASLPWRLIPSAEAGGRSIGRGPDLHGLQ